MWLLKIFDVQMDFKSISCRFIIWTELTVSSWKQDLGSQMESLQRSTKVEGHITNLILLTVQKQK